MLESITLQAEIPRLATLARNDDIEITYRCIDRPAPLLLPCPDLCYNPQLVKTMRLQNLLQPDTLRARMPHLSIRGRWIARAYRLLLTGALIALVFGALAAVANRRATQPAWDKSPIDLNADVQSLLLYQSETLYAVTTDGNVFRTAVSDDDTISGANWEQISDALPKESDLALGVDVGSGMLYASTPDETLLYSDDGGYSWWNIAQPPEVNLSPLAAQSPLTVTSGQDSPTSTFTSPISPTQPQENLQVTTPASATHPLRNLFSTEHNYGVTVRGPEGNLVWAVYGGGDFWARQVARLSLPHATVLQLSGGGVKLLMAQGTTLYQTELEVGYRQTYLAWFALRAQVAKITIWLAGNYGWLGAALVSIIVLTGASTYANLAHPFGLPPWATLLARRRLDTYARPSALETAWPDWEQVVRAQLLRFGDASVADLRGIPGPFRHYALRRYVQTHAPVQALQAQPGKVQLLTGDRQPRWHNAWITAARSIGARAGISATGREAIDKLADVLAETLGLTLGQARDFEAARACLVEAPALRLRLPPRFPLVFVADPQPSARTVQMLVDAVAVLRETGYFALVAPLEPLARQVDVAAELRQAIDRSPHVQDFIVLSRDDVLDILIARRPTQALVQNILAQVDLTVISPFVISGPVPETMFFGREAEVKMLVESAGTADFSIVGNRKIGKTSLLQRTRAKMAAGKRARPLMVDCQIVRDADSFFAAFQAQNRLPLPSPTPEGLGTALTELRQDGPPPVLLLDEVDALLSNEKKRGEPLVATWRALAQAGMCRFIFCGSTELARQLDDPSSAFFNFSQPLPLGYLSPETARLVLTQPLETLGIILEDAESLLADVQALTSGHPNLIQYLGRGLVEAANQRGERRILPDDLAALHSSTDFGEYYLKTVWGQAGPLERLITLLAADSLSPEGFQLGELETALAARDVRLSEEALDAALKLMRTYAILDKQGKTYTFTPRAFAEILHRTQEIERLIAIEKRRLRDE